MIGGVEAQIEAINSWQKCGHLHPLTCGNDSRHKPLEAFQLRDGVVALRCPDCEYVQSHVPGVVFQRWENILSGKDSILGQFPFTLSQ